MERLIRRQNTNEIRIDVLPIANKNYLRTIVFTAFKQKLHPKRFANFRRVLLSHVMISSHDLIQVIFNLMIDLTSQTASLFNRHISHHTIPFHIPTPSSTKKPYEYCINQISNSLHSVQLILSTNLQHLQPVSNIPLSKYILSTKSNSVYEIFNTYLLCRPTKSD